MPIMECTLPEGGKGFKWGHSGKCYADRKDAERQAAAAHANGFTGDMALDASARTMDADGRLHISKSHISKACVNPYYGREIPGAESLGLDPERIYYLFRSPDELAKAAPTFARLPILAKHVPISADSIPTELIVGSIGSDVEFNAPYLDADLCFWTSEAIAGIETKQVRELSCAYRYVPVMTPGTYENQSYDGVMTEIIGNHLAVVKSGRAGSDVFAADSKLEIREMKMTKMGKALFVALGAVSPKLAQDAALPALVAEVTKKTFNKADLRAKLLAMDKDAAEKVDAVMDGFEDEESPEPKEKKAADAEETEEEKEKKAADKKAKDEEAKKEADKAMDSFKRELRDADEARRAVRPIVGDVIAQDSAEEIYGFALDHLKVDHKDVKELSGLKALFALASAKTATPAVAHIAQDSAGLAAKFPNATRFRSI